MKSILLVKTFLGLVEMMSGLVNASFNSTKYSCVQSDVQLISTSVVNKP